MLRGLSLQELAARIEGSRALKRDFVADTSTLAMQVDTDDQLAIQIDESQS
jgi:hypothetical protein